MAKVVRGGWPDAVGFFGGRRNEGNTRQAGKFSLLYKAVSSGRHLARSTCVVIRCFNWRLQIAGNLWWGV